MKLINQIKLLAALVLVMLFSTEANATHMVGSDMSYRTLGNDQYEVKISVYRDCNGISLFNVNCTVTQSGGGGSASTFMMNALGFQSITPVCDTATDPCDPGNTFGSGNGVERHDFIDTIDLSGPAYASLRAQGSFRVEFQQCCRNSNISTGAANANFYSYAEISMTSGSNTSPIFFEMPYKLVHVNRPFVRNFGGYDVDGDSIVFALADPLSAAGSPVSFTMPWTKDKPFTVFEPAGVPSPNPFNNPPIGFHLDSETGILSFTPTANGEISLVVLDVFEYRNGVLISKTRREMQFWVQVIDNNTPHVISAPQEICLSFGDTLNFNIATNDAADTLFGGSPDSVFLYLDNPLPGVSLTTNNAMFQGGTVNWTPTAADFAKGDVVLTFSAIDNTCPYNHRVQKSVIVRLATPATPPTSIDFTSETDASGQTTFTTDHLPVDSVISYSWQVAGNLGSGATYSVNLQLDSTYTVVHTLNYAMIDDCGKLYYGNVAFTKQVEIKSCEAKYVIAIDTDTTNPYRIYLINTSRSSTSSLTSDWYFDGSFSFSGTGTHNFTSFGKYEVCLQISDSLCSDEYCDSVGMDSAGNLYKMEGFQVIVLDQTQLRVDELTLDANVLSTYPNPFTDELTLKFTDDHRILNVEIRNLTGKLVHGENDVKMHDYQIDTQHLSQGMYLLKVETMDHQTIYKKLIKN